MNKTTVNKRFFTRIILLGVLMTIAVPAFAHRISILGWVEGDTVYLQGNFSGGTVPVDAPITVSDPDGNVLVEGMSDENGEFSFKVPAITTLLVHINAGMGHQATCEIPQSGNRSRGRGHGLL